MTILLCTLCATICRHNDFEEISAWGKYHIKWLEEILPFESGIPEPQTFARVINALDSKKFKQWFEAWIATLCLDLKDKQIAIDGKTARGSKMLPNGHGAAHIVSALVHEYGLVLSQEKVVDKSNEITAIPELLKNLALEGSIISLDAMGTQKEIVTQVIDQKADYVMALKKNHKTFFEDVELFFTMQNQDAVYDEYEDTDGWHGRIEIRNCKVTKDITWLKENYPEWKNLCSIAAVNSIV